MISISNERIAEQSGREFLADGSSGSALADKVVLIVGGVSENGRTLAADLAEQGAHVALVYRPEAIALAQVAQRQVEAHQRECLLIPLNPAADKRQFAHSVVRQIVDTLGRLDIFIDYSSSAATGDKADGAGARQDVFPGMGMLSAALNQIAEQT